MSVSNDPGNFFQTEAYEAIAARKAAKSNNTRGDPIRLPSKLLAVIADPTGTNAVYVAESAGNLRRVDLTTRDYKSEVYRGPTAPSTSVCIYKRRIYAGCWDKTIWSWPLTGSASTSASSSAESTDGVRQFHGHSDFVKAVVCTTLPSSQPDSEPRDVVISGSQDTKVIVWDAQTTDKLHVLTGHTRGALCLGIMPASIGIDVFSGGSDGRVRCWRITSASEAGPLSRHAAADQPDQTKGDLDEVAVHETSINAIRILEMDDSEQDGDGVVLLTASSDKSARFATAPQSDSHAALNTRSAKSLPHPDFVLDIVSLQSPDDGLVATACRDEGVRVWDVTGDDDSSEPHVLHCFDGHYEEVTGLAVVGDSLVSVSIDGTVRTWPATRLKVLAQAEAEAEEERQRQKQDQPAGRRAAAAAAVEIDADEEAELAALMEEDDD